MWFPHTFLITFGGNATVKASDRQRHQNYKSDELEVLPFAFSSLFLFCSARAM